MLSRVAENLYWLGRYLERAEDTARIVNVNAHLLLDLPKGIAPGWKPIIDILGDSGAYRERHGDFEERSVVRFMVADANNPSSILRSLAAAREDARSIREIIPREAWEQLNELYLYARDDVQAGLAKRSRYGYLKRIILGAGTITGVLAGVMNHDEGYNFLRIGELIERADMTTRIIDVRSATLLPEETSGLRPFENIQWMSVLKSLSAYQMYRQRMQVRVRRADALRFLLQDYAFPRSCLHCVTYAQSSVAELPRNEGPLRAIGRVERTIKGAEVAALSQDELHEFIDRLQIGLAQVHEELARTYFLVEAPAPEGTQTGVPNFVTGA